MQSNVATPQLAAMARVSGGTSWLIRRGASASTLVMRAVAGNVFLLEGSLKFLDPGGFGVGRFAKIGIPLPSFFAPFDGVFEIGCGVCLMLGLLTRLSTVPMIVNMIVAITTTKVPILLDAGFFKAAHEARLDVTMLVFCAFLLLTGAGPLSLDAVFAPEAVRRRRILAAERRR